MNWDKDLNLQQLDQTLARVAGIDAAPRPLSGWINTIRTALGMSARNLGERLGLSQPRVASIEKGEVEGSISLNTLEKAAQGLGCRVVYVLIPEAESLQEMRKRQAFKKARALNRYAERHMELEDQATDEGFREEASRQLAEEYLKKWPRDFWDQ